MKIYVLICYETWLALSLNQNHKN